MSELVKIQMNLKDGFVLVEAPQDSLDLVFSKLESFIPKITTQQSFESPEKPVKDDNHLEEIGQVSEEQNQKSIKKKKNSTKPPETYRPVELGINQDQRIAFRKFYQDKKPSSQNQHVLVTMYWLIKEAGKKSLTIDEIFTGLKTVNERIPGRISSVLSNLKIDGKVIADGGKFTLHHTGEDYVNLDLPIKKENSK